MTPAQIKFAAYGVSLLVLWLLSRRGGPPAAPVGRRTTIVDVDADVYSPTFGMTDAEIAASRANPGVNPALRDLIDRSNAAIAQDNIINGVE
jgi:hypothetical protein